MSYLIQIRSFVDVYRAGSISKAATRLGISQPAVSSHIHSLESFTGTTLFKRSSHGVVPTAEGDELARLIAHDLDTIESKLATLRGYAKRASGTISIVGPAELLWATLASVIKPIISDDLRFQVVTGNRKKIYASLIEGTSQIGFTTSRPDQQRFGYEEIGKEKLVIVASASAAREISQSKNVLDALCKLPLITYDEQLPLIREVFQGMPQILAALRPFLTVPDLRILERMIKQDVGWTVMPEYLCAQSIKDEQILEVSLFNDFPMNSIYLVWNESALRNPLVMYVKNRIVEIAKRGDFGGQTA
ncbi:LysR family transcriptional regulator [Erwinia sp. S43]|uniref:LysR family transcriptional regulator n=1 Tax=Erwinia sp. S43 TaxID=2769339 RepID=UPI00190AB1B2|nr:LysR family transcriptional regulator [Erwinia sp. S43]MBK0032573.1 LysR family transcriptional regulator [Erwinia sp. S43]